ncbi:LpxL/LpxP family Kdo(2)-lipid IV(A) lauroyl/palmitoleoyl acyltransferase [Candidatus Halobeggiatoa sp. HSG11]|nr:LpxL/LpxP family Kdo(2)-lipid IV(A) lauroyl/palmitoleoyl acyltransferase [Candidatus Halobeggiatoa sp. HSG11]
MNLLSLLTPRYWPLWIGIGIFWSLIHLPHRWRLVAGRKIGRIFCRLTARRRKIATVNLKLCFPELTEKQLHDLLHQHFESLGMGLLEMLSAWWQKDSLLKPLEHIEGLEHLDAALKRGKGVILLSAHLTSLELGCRFLTMHTIIHAVYRQHENPLIEYFMKKSREGQAEKAIPRDNVRAMLRSLKNNKPVWLATDQNFGHKNSVFADFFGIPAATNIAIPRLAKMSGATIIPFFTQRLANNQGYKVILQPALENFPSGDDVEDVSLINKLIETQVRQAPEQYLWVHRRFKDRPHGEKSFYD